MQCLRRPEKGVKFPGTGIIDVVSDRGDVRS